MSAFAMRFDVTPLVSGLDKVSAKAIPTAVRRAMVRTTNSAKVALSRDIAQDMGLLVGTVKDELKTKVTETASGEFVGQVSVSGKRIPLIDFGGKGPMPSRGRGRVTAKVQGSRKRYPGAFVAQMASGHTGIFKRVGAGSRKSRGAWSRNLPIVELHGPSLPHVFAAKAEVGLKRAEEQFVKELQHEVAFALSQVSA